MNNIFKQIDEIKIEENDIYRQHKNNFERSKDAIKEFFIAHHKFDFLIDFYFKLEQIPERDFIYNECGTYIHSIRIENPYYMLRINPSLNYSYNQTLLNVTVGGEEENIEQNKERLREAIESTKKTIFTMRIMLELTEECCVREIVFDKTLYSTKSTHFLINSLIQGENHE